MTKEQEDSKPRRGKKRTPESEKRREVAIDALLNGESIAEAARMSGIRSRAVIVKIAQELIDQGFHIAKGRPGPKPAPPKPRKERSQLDIDEARKRDEARALLMRGGITASEAARRVGGLRRRTTAYDLANEARAQGADVPQGKRGRPRGPRISPT